MRQTKILSFITLFGPVALLGACAPVVPPELTNARRAYNQAQAGIASQTAPAELHKAKLALDEAERSFDDKPHGQKTLDRAYIAERKAQQADAIGRATQARRDRYAWEREFTQTQTAIIGDQRERFGAERQARMTAEEKAREAERLAREAENEAKQTQAKLAEFANVKHDTRGTVITLSGSVIFPSNQAVLLPEARIKLDQVADALMASKEKNIVIEGYTDARGSDEHNMDLSRRRAEAVRSYIVSKGYDGDLVIATGMGKANPVADNATAEGRANNRRVEIVVKDKGD